CKADPRKYASPGIGAVLSHAAEFAVRLWGDERGIRCGAARDRPSLSRILHSYLPAYLIHRPAHEQAERMAQRGAFDKPLFHTAHRLPDLVFETIDHRFQLNGLSGLACPVPFEMIIAVPWPRDTDHAFCAGDLGGQRGLAGQRAAHQSGCPVPVFENGMAGFIAARWRQRSRRRDTVWFAEQLQTEVQWIDADIEQGAAAQPEIVEPARFIEWRGEAEVRTDIAYLPDAAGVCQRDDFAHNGEEPGPHRFHQEGMVLAGSFDHGADLDGGQCHGFFAKHGFAALQAKQAMFGVKTMRGGNIDRVE